MLLKTEYRQLSPPPPTEEANACRLVAALLSLSIFFQRLQQKQRLQHSLDTNAATESASAPAVSSVIVGYNR